MESYTYFINMMSAAAEQAQPSVANDDEPQLGGSREALEEDMSAFT